jgi:hypothetical protein
VKFNEDITPMLKSLGASLSDTKEGLRELGEFMATGIRSAMNRQVGLGNGKPYKILSTQYALRKGRVGGNINRILYGPSPGRNVNKGERGGEIKVRTRGGELAASWRRIRLTKTEVHVGAAGHDGSGTKNADKARGLNDRLDISWSDRMFKQAGSLLLDSVVEKANKNAPRTK